MLLAGARLGLVGAVFVAVVFVPAPLAAVRVVREVQPDVHGLVLPSVRVVSCEEERENSE